MEETSPSHVAAASEGNAAGTPIFWGAVITFVVVANFAVADRSIRVEVLRGILILLAAGEGVGGALGVFRTPWFAERNGRPYDPAYHGVSQDFGFYNLAFALLFALAAVDPMRSTMTIAVASALYVVHGVTHLCRYFGLYFAGGTPIATRPQQLEMRDGLTLLAGAAGMLLFFP